MIFVRKKLNEISQKKKKVSVNIISAGIARAFSADCGFRAKGLHSGGFNEMKNLKALEDEKYNLIYENKHFKVCLFQPPVTSVPLYRDHFALK
jgi:hypothetical protein